jgi:parallel beta-helix repeat protein
MPRIAIADLAVLLTAGVLAIIVTEVIGWREPGDAATQEKDPREYQTRSEAKPTTPPTCTSSLQAKVEAAPPGATVRADPCIYRETVIIDKPITLQGQPNTEIRGSSVWNNWKKEGDYWRRGTLPDSSAKEHPCMPGTSRCLWPEQVFLDGRPLTQVASDPGPGQFAVDSHRNVLLKDDPRGHLMEVTTRRYWVLGKADSVTIEGFTMRQAANEAQSGAIMNRMKREDVGYADWTLQNSELSDAHGAVVSLANATGLKVLDNEISRGGQLGIGGTGPGEIIRDNEVHDNNTEGFDPGWGAGGLKTAYASEVTVDSNEFYGNAGNAIWFDIDCRNNTISSNRIHHNANLGILYEISDHGKIFGNVLWENGWAAPQWALGSGIGISNSRNVEVSDNILAWNADGIAVLSLDREGTSWDDVRDVYVHDNTILATDYPADPEGKFALAWLQGWSTQMFASTNNNRGANNKYWYPDTEGGSTRYEWRLTHYSRLAAFNSTPGEENGRYLTRGEKETVVTMAGIPDAQAKP